MAVRKGRNESSGPDKNTRDSNYKPFSQNASDTARAQRAAASAADDKAYWNRLTEAKQAEARALQKAQIDNKLYGIPMPGSAPTSDANATKSTAKKNAVQRALAKFRGKGKAMGIPGGDLKNLRR